MPTSYAGNPANWPTSVPVPSGSDAPSSTLFASGFEGTIDRTAWLKANMEGGQAAAGYWTWTSNPRNLSSGNTDFLGCACYDPTYGQWLVGGLNEQATGAAMLMASKDDGKSWLLSATYGSPGPVYGGRMIASNADGNLPTAMCVNPATGTFCMLQVQLTGGIGGAATIQRQASDAAPTYAANPFLDLSAAIFSGCMFMGIANVFNLFLVQESGTTYTTLFANGGVDGAGTAGVWFNATSTLP